MKKFVLVIPMIVLAACVAPSTKAQPERNIELIELSSSQVRSLERAVKNNLKDSSSAQFGRYITFNVENVDGTTMTGACGYVNAKNSYGGYVGMTPYIALGVDGAFVTASISEYKMGICKEMYGVSI
jgi:opacity protein-like surface antigen